MNKYIAKIEKRAKTWGGDEKITTEFFGVRANNDEEARKEFESMLSHNETILYFSELSKASKEDIEAYNNE